MQSGQPLFALYALLLLTLPDELTFPICYFILTHTPRASGHFCHFSYFIIATITSLLDYSMSSDCCITIDMASIRSVVVGVFKLPKRCPSLEFRMIRIDFSYQAYVLYLNGAEYTYALLALPLLQERNQTLTGQYSLQPSKKLIYL